MGILSRLRRNLESLALRRPSAPGEPGQFSFAAEIPGTDIKTPLWRVEVQMASGPHGDGEKMRLRAHIQTNLASALRPALEAPKTQDVLTSDSRPPSPAQRVGAMAQRAATRALSVPLVRALAQPLLQHDFNTWIEMQASTASLDKGSGALLPQSEKLAALGIRPQRRDGPMAETWAGEAPGGFAQVSLLQLDKQHLPPQLVGALGDKPFHFAAAIVNTVEEKLGSKD